MAPSATATSTAEQQNDVLDMHKDHLSDQELNLKDTHVSSSLGLFIIHNVIRRNLRSCSEGAKTVTAANVNAFLTYAHYTLFVTEDQIESADTIWFPVLASYDHRFEGQIKAHEELKKQIDALKTLLPPQESNVVAEDLETGKISEGFAELYNIVNEEYDREEQFSNELGHKVPIAEIKELEKKQEARRLQSVRTYGHLWCAVYLLRSMNTKERGIFPPGLPRIVASGMMTGGALQYRKELQFAPKFTA